MSKLQKIIEDIKNNTITELYLYDNKIGDEGAKAIADAFKDNYTITELNLSLNEIGNKNTKEKIDDIIKRNIEYQKNTIKFLNDNFVEKNDKVIINLLDNIKDFKIFQNINENICK